MKSDQAYTLIELLVGFMIGTVMILMIGTVLNIGTVSHKKVRDEAAIYSDLSYSFRFLRNRVRETALIIYDPAPSAPWQGTRLVLTKQGLQSAFGIIVSGNKRSFIFAPDINNMNQVDVLLTVKNELPDNLSFYLTPYGKRIVANLTGERDKVPFNLSSSIMKRIQ